MFGTRIHAGFRGKKNQRSSAYIRVLIDLVAALPRCDMLWDYGWEFFDAVCDSQ